MSKDIKSPCISVCALNDDDLCIGCFRSATEISRWGEFSAEQKKAVVLAADARRLAAQPVQLK